MDLHLLGQVEASLDGRPIPLGATKQRAVLAMLALQPNATVAVDRLVDGLWGEDPPASAPKMVQLYVSQLRRLFAGEGAQIVTHGRGYELCVPADAVDVARFERLVDQAGRSDRSPNEAARNALELWHGAPLADVAGEPFAAAEIRRLEELWLRAAELTVDSDLAAGQDHEALAQLERLIEEHPLRERLHAQRMLALYRSGRQAEALEAYAELRRRLVEEIGVEPGAELRDLQGRVLAQDPSLHLPAPPAEVPSARHEPRAPPREALPPIRRPLVLALIAGAVIAVTAFAVVRLADSDPLPGIEEGAVGVIDANAGEITDQYRIGSEPGAMAGGAGSVWVASPREGTVARIHRDGDRVDTIDVGPAPAALAFGSGSLWVAAGEDGSIAQVDPTANRVVQRIPVGNGLAAVTVGHGALWAATALDGEVVRIDLRSGRVAKRIAVGGHPVALATGAGAVWAAAEDSGTVVRVDPESGDVLDAIAVGNGPSALTVGFGAVWAANRQDGTVSRIDPATDRVTDTLPAGRAPVALVAAAGALWVADAAGAVLRLDPGSRSIAERVRTDSTPRALTAVDGAVWVAAAAAPAAHRGGTLRYGSLPIRLDPGDGGYDPDSVSVIGLAYDGLLAYRREAGVAGARLVGGLAVAVPEPAGGGRRYVFRLRPGLRYSDGTRVRAGDFRSSMERAWRIQGRFMPPFWDAIEGGARCRAVPKSCDLSRGISSDESTGTITIRLRRPDQELLQKLTLPLLSIVPASTPRRELPRRPPPGTGPYRIDRVVPGRRALLTRNRYFRARGLDGRPAGFAGRVEVTMGAEDAQVAAVERGRLDLAAAFDSTAERLAALRTRVGTRVKSGSAAFTEYAWLNVEAPPFDDPRVRRALNLAVDRARVVELTGGSEAGSPTCQVLPPGLPGYRPICPFTVAASPAGAWTAPDRARAQRLVTASGARGTPVEIWTWPDRLTVGRHLVDVLSGLGFPSRLRVFDELDRYLEAQVDPRRRPQIGVTGWIADYPEPGAFLRALVSCKAYVPGDPQTSNASRFCDRSIDAAIGRAQAAGPGARAAWQRIERRIADSAPVAPLATRRWVAVTSARAENLRFNPIYGVLLEQIWVK